MILNKVALYTSTVIYVVEPALKFMTIGFDKFEKTLDLYENSYTKDACPRYNQLHNESYHGIKLMNCTDVFGGIVTKVPKIF